MKPKKGGIPNVSNRKHHTQDAIPEMIRASIAVGKPVNRKVRRILEKEARRK